MSWHLLASWFKCDEYRVSTYDDPTLSDIHKISHMVQSQSNLHLAYTIIDWSESYSMPLSKRQSELTFERTAKIGGLVDLDSLHTSSVTQPDDLEDEATIITRAYWHIRNGALDTAEEIFRSTGQFQRAMTIAAMSPPHPVGVHTPPVVPLPSFM